MSDKTMKNIPKLRFPEFVNDGEWEEKKLSDLIYTITPPKKLLTNQYLDKGSFPIIDQSQKYIAGWTNDKESIIRGKLPLIIFGDHTCALKLINQPFAQGADGIKIFEANSQYLTTNYLYQFLQFNPLIMEEYKRHFSILRDKLVKYPNKNSGEQQKIADCLSSLDSLITAQSQKVELLKEHKKGLLQNLFPRDGENIPKFRFPEFVNDGEWEEKILGDVVDYENGKAHENDISENGDYIVVNSKFISTEGEIVKYTDSAFCLASKNDILMVLSDVPNGRAIAKCYLVEFDNLYTVNQRICKITTKKTISKFLFYVIDRNKYFLSFDDGVKQTNLRKEDVLNCPIVISSNSDEQQKIANSLSLVDEQINQQTKKLEALKEHKKALLQQLFPSNEVNK
ncbi:restriction endonuclease subunit S [Aliarcobacter cryaerophilus]|uniref:restriction endonuclease subunit S n=1 Tax=Aliarcobacter cryaerophilus TaxID=28198 RepID=UPI0021B4086F|nr:restriction endonuclease subunit S [Aliarcobacter cryaerophilus]MCT7469035.1 restriction endonuclease subunit S [Aliarcobacter cryaerophilus]